MNLLRPIASIFGYDVIRKSKDVLLFRHLPRVFSAHGINCIIDVGANKGQYGLELRKLGYTGVIHSFEPLSEAFEILNDCSKTDSLWFAHNFALGSSASKMDINIAKYSDFSSFLQPNKYSTTRFEGKSNTVRQQSVNIRRLDTTYPELEMVSGEARIHLKMDTQGYDLEVFSGAKDILGQIQTLQSEISIRALYESMPDYLSALKAYQNEGFNISGMFPVSRDKHDLSVIEFDCVMVKTLP